VSLIESCAEFSEKSRRQIFREISDEFAQAHNHAKLDVDNPLWDRRGLPGNQRGVVLISFFQLTVFNRGIDMHDGSFDSGPPAAGRYVVRTEMATETRPTQQPRRTRIAFVNPLPEPSRSAAEQRLVEKAWEDYYSL